MFVSIFVFVLLTVSVHTKVTIDAPLDNIINKIIGHTKENKGTIKVYTSNDIKKGKIHDIESTVEPEIREVTNNSIDDGISNDTAINDNSTALILTSLVEEGKFEEARTACRVDSAYFLGVESYSGYFTVNKTYNSNLFFWYFPNAQRPANDTPWVIWLQGGPGASSMTGLFDEIGPFTVGRHNDLRKNPNTWAVNHSLLFIDNPVGTGFSYTDSSEGFVKDMETYSSHLYSAVEQFLKIFPELRGAPLYVAGESYGGKYAPSLAMRIHQRKLSSETDINLQGLILGNAYVDPQMISHLTRTFYNFGLLDGVQMKIVKPLEDGFRADIAANRSVAAKTKWNYLVTSLLLLSYQQHAYNFMRDDLALGRYKILFSRPEIRRAIHVGNIEFGFVNITVNKEMAPDFLISARPFMETLLEHYRVLTYCGQLDQMLACTLTSENYQLWRWSGADEYHNATRYPFMHRGLLAGYQKSGGRLTEVLIRGAGHMVPLDAGGAAQALVTAFTHNLPIPKPTAMIGIDFIDALVRNVSVVSYL